MADHKLLSKEEQIELVNNAQTRMDAVASAWLQNPKIKAAVLQPKDDPCDGRKAS
jgi:hypothetical protein